MTKTAILFAGITEKNPNLFRRIGVPLGDPAAWVQMPGRTVAVVRDLEMDRVRSRSQADLVTCPAECARDSQLDADRETATAQALAMWCQQEQVTTAKVDRTFPFIYAAHLQEAGVSLKYDPDLGVLDRRQKSGEEIEKLAESQSVTESVMELICQTIARCDASAAGILQLDGSDLTSERVRAMAAAEFLKRDYSMSHGAICATAPEVADCHHAGTGALRKDMPIIVDLFPMNNQTRYWGDCTRTVVNGQPSDTVKAMHAAVVRAKAASEAALRLGSTGDQVHRASEESLVSSGYVSSRGTLTDGPSIQHGTGHGIGLEVHEPILLDFGGGEILLNEAFTIEPGLYGRDVGGVRVEDMLIVTEGDPRNLNRLQEGLDWS